MSADKLITRLNHVAIAVPDLEAAAARYAALGARVSEPAPLPDHGVTVVFVTLENTKIELLHPLGEASPVAAFLERNPDGGVHHICLETEALGPLTDMLAGHGIRILGPATNGAHGRPVIFAHPKDFQGTLIEFEAR